MGQQKIGLCVRMKAEDRASLQTYANRERRTLGNLSEILLTWALEKLERAGGTEKLIGRRLPIPRRANGNYRRVLIEGQREAQGVRASFALSKPSQQRKGLRQHDNRTL